MYCCRLLAHSPEEYLQDKLWGMSAETPQLCMNTGPYRKDNQRPWPTDHVCCGPYAASSHVGHSDWSWSVKRKTTGLDARQREPHGRIGIDPIWQQRAKVMLRVNETNTKNSTPGRIEAAVACPSSVFSSKTWLGSMLWNAFMHKEDLQREE